MNSKPETNWIDLPVEMQWECIKHLDFKTRMRLRATSKTDKSVVESAPKHHFDNVEIKWSSWDFPFTVKYKNGADEFKLECELKEDGLDEVFLLEKGPQLALQVIKFGDAEKFIFNPEFFAKNAVEKFLSEIANYTPFRFKELQLLTSVFRVTHFFLENCENVETIKLESFLPNYKVENETIVMNLPSVINAKKIRNHIEQEAENACELIEKWMELDADLGKTLQAHLSNGDNIERIAAKFQERIVYKKPSELRIRTDNESKHILVRAVNNRNCNVSFVFIPADQLESEYEEDGEWIEECGRMDMGDFMRGITDFFADPNSINEMREFIAQIGNVEPDPADYEDYYEDLM